MEITDNKWLIAVDFAVKDEVSQFQVFAAYRIIHMQCSVPVWHVFYFVNNWGKTKNNSP